MLRFIVLLCCWSFFSVVLRAQDTFSIVAVDPETGEVGSAGASCVDLSAFALPPDFLGELFPGVGAINTQAFYLPDNQASARIRMQAGDTPFEIIQWLIANDAQNDPTIRQYGVVRIVDGEGQAAAHTGDNTQEVTGDRVGDNYSIQGNILLSPEILDNMEAGFNNTEGNLAQKMMAAMQGANVPGADSRCLNNGTSSLFAFLKVAQPGDNFGQPSLNIGVSFSEGNGIEPLDTLQNLLDAIFPTAIEEVELGKIQVYPNPAQDQVVFDFLHSPIGNTSHTTEKYQLSIYDQRGVSVFRTRIDTPQIEVRKESLGTANQLYIYKIQDPSGSIVRSGKIVFQ